MNYKYQLFEKAIALEQQMNQKQAQKKDLKKIIRQFSEVIEEISANQWREEYDLWTQTLHD